MSASSSIVRKTQRNVFQWRINRGFTLLELLMAVSVILVLISLLLPAIQQAREAARRVQCQNNLMQIGVAFRNYNQAHSFLPPGCINPTGPVFGLETAESSGNGSSTSAEQTAPAAGDYRMGWVPQLLPFMGNEGHWRMVDFDIPQCSFNVDGRAEYERQRRLWVQTTSDAPVDAATATNAADDSESGAMGMGMGFAPYDPGQGAPVLPVLQASQLPAISWLQCPSESRSGPGTSSYAGSHHSSEKPIDEFGDGLLYLNSSESLNSIPDGASSTILAGEQQSSLATTSMWLWGDRSTLKNGGNLKNAGLGADAADEFFDYSAATEEEKLKRKTSEQSRVGTFGSAHTYAVGFLFADGSVQFLSGDMSASVFASLINRRDSRSTGTAAAEF